MKIKPQERPPSARPTRSEAAAPRPPADAPPPANKGWQAGPARPHLQASRQALAGAATEAVVKAIVDAPSTPAAKHPLVERFGEALGLGLGVIVTEALSLNPGWNTPVLDAQGKPVTEIEGAARIGNHDLLKRHQEVVGPKVTALVQQLPPGLVHDLVAGLGKGATAAPGTSYRLEAAVADALTRR